jgi:hypothetical protein
MNRPLPSGLLVILIASALGAAPRCVAADAAKPVETVTSGPAVLLPAQQRADLAAKRIPSTGAPAALLIDTKLLVVDPSRTAPHGPAGTPRASVGAVNPLMRSSAQVGPALGRIPRPEWNAPWMPHKLGEVAQIGGHLVPVERGPNVAPAGRTVRR